MVGAGQLARMTAQAAISLGIEFKVLADGRHDSAAQVCPGTVIGDYRSAADLLGFAAGCDVVTFDHEHVPSDHLAELERTVAIRPGRSALRFAQDKLAMRDMLSSLAAVVRLGVRCPRYRLVFTLADVLDEFGLPVALKAVSGGYDGKGVWICESKQAVEEVLSHGIALVAEEYVAFDRELAVLVARSPKGQGASYPVAETVQLDGICREVIAPAPGLDPEVAITAQRLGLAVAAELDVTGLLAIELFSVGRELVINELAMRPHNCGHWTIDGAVTSQFEQHLRAVLDLPLGSTRSTAASAVMVNVLGGDDPGPWSSGASVRQGGTTRAQGRPRDGGRQRRGTATRPSLAGRELPEPGTRGTRGGERSVTEEPVSARPPSGRLPAVGVVMGSDSDWPVMRAAAEVLTEFGVAYEVDVVSAHRMPHDMIAYGSAAAERGLRVIVAGAGGAAHLPGMLASVTPLPVIGVPVPLAHLDGLDSLLSVVQMPAGIPVATVAIGGARNAGLLAVRILAVADPELRRQMLAFQDQLRQAAQAKGTALRAKLTEPPPGSPPAPAPG